MPITIQEIIASDTISQLVDKTNFNFDQILLNGGGPAGPAGPIGPIGPAGGRGPKGTTWYDGADDPNTTPPTATPLKGDYYLRDSNSNPPLNTDGDVWEYTGLTWSFTGINLTGPVGPAGASGGFGLFFGNPINSKQALYNGVVGYGPTGGASADNQGIASIMIGGAVSNTTTSPGQFPLDDDYKIPLAVTNQLQSNVASLMIHQKNALGKSIVFHGGYGPTAVNDKYWQGNLTNLSNISIGVDDVLTMGVPKPATLPINIDDLIGYKVDVPQRGHQYIAGKQISFVSGIDASPSGLGQDANFTIEVRQGSNGPGNKFETIVQGTAAQSKMQLGKIGALPTTQNNNIGDFNLEAGRVNIVTSDFGGALGDIRMLTAGPILLDTTYAGGTGYIQAKTKTGSILLETESGGANGNITIRQSGNSGNAEGNIAIDNFSVGSAGTGVSGTSNILIRGNRQLKMQKQNVASVADVLDAPSITIDWGNTTPHTRRVGQQTWGPTGLTNPITTTNPLANLTTTIQRYYDISSPLASQPGQVITQYGNGLTNNTMQPEGVYMKFINAESTQITNAAPTIQIKRAAGPFGSPSRNGLIQISSQQDNAAGLAGFQEWWSLSQKNVMTAVPLVFSRTSVRDENLQNTIPPSSENSTYIWNTLSAGAPPVDFIETLERPFIEVNVGRGLEGAPNVQQPFQLNNEGYEYDIYMPTTTPITNVSSVPPLPGSTFVIDIINRSTSYTNAFAGTQLDENSWGTVVFKVPIMRARKSPGDPWQPWVYKDYYITAPECRRGTFGEAWVARLSGTLTWNGSIRFSFSGRRVATNPAGKFDMDVQLGYTTGGLADNVDVVDLNGSYGV